MFKETKYKAALAEIFQSLEIKMAYCNRKGGEYTNQHAFVNCRDFLGDVLHSENAQKAVNIYGFNYNAVTKPILKRKLCLALKFPDKGTMETFLANHKRYGDELVHFIGVGLGEYLCDYQKNIIVWTAPSFWRKSTVALSLLTYIFKCFGYALDHSDSFNKAVLCTKFPYKDWDGSVTLRKTIEAEYMEQTKGKWQKLLLNLKRITKNLDTPTGHPKDAHISTVHNRSGFISVIEGCGVVGERLGKVK